MASSAEQYDYLIRLMLVGESGIGKTCFLFYFIDDSFTSSVFPTIGFEFKNKIIRVDDKLIKLQIVLPS